MSGDHVPAKPDPSGLAFDPRTPSMMVRRGMDRLNAIVAAKEDGPNVLWMFFAYGRHKTYERKPPTALAVQAENIPEELKRLRQWVCWDWAWHGDQSWDGKGSRWYKPPIDAKTGSPASVEIYTTWSSFEDAIASTKRYRLAGIGFVFTPEDPYAGVDIDDCRDPETGQLTNYAAGIVSYLRSYTDISPSGTGVHVLVKGTISTEDRYVRKSTPELYDREQYFAFTGHLLAASEPNIAERQRELVALDASPSPTISGWPDDESVKFLWRTLGATDELILFRCWDGHDRVLGVETGRELWCWTWDEPSDTEPLLVSNAVVMWVDGDVVSFDARTGNEQWRFSSPGPQAGLAMSLASEEILLLSYLGNGGQELIGINARSGSRVWSLAQSMDGSFITLSDTIYVNDMQTLAAIEPSSGVVKWRTQYEGEIQLFYFHRFTEAAETIVQLSRSYSDKQWTSFITGFDTKEGNRLWVRSSNSSVELIDGSRSNVVLYKETLRYRSCLHAVEPRTGEYRWTREASHGFGNVIVLPHVLVAVEHDETRRLAAINLQDGETKWTTPASDSLVLHTATPGILLTQELNAHNLPDVFRALDTESGRLNWHAYASAAVVYQSSVILLVDGMIRMLDLQTGENRWSEVFLEDRFLPNLRYDEVSLTVAGRHLHILTDHAMHTIQLPVLVPIKGPTVRGWTAAQPKILGPEDPSTLIPF